jgi:hypothetical protein
MISDFSSSRRKPGSIQLLQLAPAFAVVTIELEFQLFQKAQHERATDKHSRRQD